MKLMDRIVQICVLFVTGSLVVLGIVNLARAGENRNLIEENNASLTANHQSIDENRDSVKDNTASLDESRDSIDANTASLDASSSSLEEQTESMTALIVAVERNTDVLAGKGGTGDPAPTTTEAPTTTTTVTPTTTTTTTTPTTATPTATTSTTTTTTTTTTSVAPRPTPTVELTYGGPGPTEVASSHGVACAASRPRCLYLGVELSEFDPGRYSVACNHDGWANFGPETWWVFDITVDAGGQASRNGPCFINFDRLSFNGRGVQVVVSRGGTEIARSNWLR